MSDETPCGNPGCLRPGCGANITVAESEAQLKAAFEVVAARLAEYADRLAVEDVLRQIEAMKPR